MRKNGWAILAIAVGMLLLAGFPYPGPAAVQAEPGCCGHAGKGHAAECPHHKGGCPDCPHHAECPGCPGCAGQGVPPCMQDNAAAPPYGMHRMMHGGPPPPAREAMGKHVEEMRAAIAKLREIEEKMAGQVRDGEPFRRLSLEHAKLLTDIQASHLRHMERMTGGGK